MGSTNLLLAIPTHSFFCKARTGVTFDIVSTLSIGEWNDKLCHTHSNLRCSIDTWQRYSDYDTPCITVILLTYTHKKNSNRRISASVQGSGWVYSVYSVHRRMKRSSCRTWSMSFVPLRGTNRGQRAPPCHTAIRDTAVDTASWVRAGMCITAYHCYCFHLFWTIFDW